MWTGIFAGFGFAGTLLIMAVWRLVVQRKQLSSGRSIGCFTPNSKNGKFLFENHITIAAGGVWCRLTLRFKARMCYQINRAPKYFFKRPSLAIGSPYTIALFDKVDRLLYREEDTLAHFLPWTGGGEHITETLFGEKVKGTQEGRITLLEFLPKQAGPYKVVLEMESLAEGQSPSSSSRWEVLEAELTVSENVIPLSKMIKYPHHRIHI